MRSAVPRPLYILYSCNCLELPLSHNDYARELWPADLATSSKLGSRQVEGQLAVMHRVMPA